MGQYHIKWNGIGKHHLTMALPTYTTQHSRASNWPFSALFNLCNLLFSFFFLEPVISLPSSVMCRFPFGATPLTQIPLDKMTAVSQTTFWMHFHEWKVSYFDPNTTEVCSWGSNWQCVSIGSGNGLAPNRRHAITWSNTNPVYWRINATLGETG